MRVKRSIQCAAALTIAAACMPGRANASAIDVALANETVLTNQTGNSTNQGIYPITSYSNTSDGKPNQISIPAAPSVNYDAADENDTGTMWNVVQATSTTPTSNSTGNTVDVLYEQGIALKDSSGATTNVTMDVSEILPNGKADNIHASGSNGTTAGTDGLAPAPNGVNDGITSGSSHNELMGSEWITNSASEGLLFTLHGLTAGNTYDLYVYGAGNANGEGGAFSLAAGNQLTTGGVSSASTNTSSSSLYRSVFSAAGGNNPAPEMGLSWNELIGMADSNGNFTFQELQSGDSVKPSMNGFQIDAVPEPSSLALIAVAGLALRRRK
ncbi:MAG TPA: PEP-CTERM sorting domain-containing protein [Tepidisphaeraceae bacterium]|jgi:hypothetical protein